MNLKDAITKLFTDAKDIAQTIAPLAAVLGFIGVGIMYMGSGLPLIGDWKRDNPKAANALIIGLLFVVAASTITSVIVFS